MALQGIALMGAERRNKMKKLMALVLAVCFMLAMGPAMVFATDVAGGYYETHRIYSAATGTTNAVNTSVYSFVHPVTTIACDVYSSTTNTVTFQIVGNNGYSTTFNTGTGALMPAVTTTGMTATQKIIPSILVKSYKGIITTPTVTTYTITVRCTGSR